MAALRAPMLRHLVNGQLRSLRASNQRRWAQVHDVRFLATTQPVRNTLEKYREKLDRKARAEGHHDIESLKSAYSDKIESLRKEAAAAVPIPGLVDDEPTPRSSSSTSSDPSSPPPPRSAAASTSTSGNGIKPLSEILDLPKARELPVPELSAVWQLRYAASPNALSAVIPTATYAGMEAAARAHPQFVLPVPHPEQGAEMHFLQWTFDAATRTSTVLFTQLAEYKARGEWAQPHTTVTHHADLADEKGVVLMQGTVVGDRGVKPATAQWLVMCLQRFYGGWDGVGDEVARERAEERRRLLQWFAEGDERFSVEKLMEEAERLA